MISVGVGVCKTSRIFIYLYGWPRSQMRREGLFKAEFAKVEVAAAGAKVEVAGRDAELPPRSR